MKGIGRADKPVQVTDYIVLGFARFLCYDTNVLFEVDMEKYHEKNHIANPFISGWICLGS